MSDGIRIIRRRRWTPAEDQMVRDLYGQMDAAELGRRIDRTEDSIWIRARKLGLDKREEVHDPWTEAELDEVRRCYATERPADIAKRLGRTTSAVSQQAACLGVISRKATTIALINHGYFSEVTGAEQAYILGLLAADGCVQSGLPRIALGLQAKDAHLVEFVRDRLSPLAGLSRTADGFTTLQVTSREMVADLAVHGITPRKSRTLSWPAHLGDLQRPFLTGYFDGDGWMHLPRDRHGRQRPGWGACSGSEQFIVDMKEYIRVAAGVGLQKIYHRPGADLWSVSVTGAAAVVLDEFLHQDGLGLERKRFPAQVVAPYLRAG